MLKFPTRTVLAVAAVSLMLLACSGTDKTSPNGDQAPLGSGGPAVPEKKSAFHKPVPADFALAVKVLEKSCFGSAGCNITYRIDVTYTAAVPLDPTVTYEVIYEVKGGDDPKVGTLTVKGDQVRREERDLIQTPSSKSELTAVVTSVDG